MRATIFHLPACFSPCLPLFCSLNFGFEDSCLFLHYVNFSQLSVNFVSRMRLIGIILWSHRKTNKEYFVPAWIKVGSDVELLLYVVLVISDSVQNFFFFTYVNFMNFCQYKTISKQYYCLSQIILRQFIVQHNLLLDRPTCLCSDNSTLSI